MKKIKKALPLIIFVIALLFVVKYLKFDEHLSKRPSSVHVWAQCMRASIAKNYYEESFNFFYPRLHTVLDGEGITGLEFPFVNYSVAILYKFFGFDEFYFRGFMMLSLFIGLGFFFFLCNSFIKNTFISLLIVGLCFFSPVLVYYTTNFMPDVTSLGLVLIGWYMFFRYLKTKKMKFLYWLFLVFTLASLIKVTSLISFCVLICLLVLDKLRFFNSTNKGLSIINDKKKLIFLIITGFVLVFGWYAYAQWLSAAYHSNAFTLGTEYAKTKEQFLEVWDMILKNWEGEYYRPSFYYSLYYMLIIIIVFAKYVSRLLFSITFFTTLGSIAFALLMFKQFTNHDYYIIPLLPSVFFLILTFFDLIVRLSNNFFPPIKYVISYLALLTLFSNAAYSRDHYLDRHSPNYLQYTGDFSQYYDLETKLRSLGIKKHEVTLVGSDYTYCNGLYLMNQMGYQFSDYNNVDYLNSLLALKPKYLILNDTSAFNKAYPNNFKDKIIGNHKGLIIYKLY